MVPDGKSSRSIAYASNFHSLQFCVCRDAACLKKHVSAIARLPALTEIGAYDHKWSATDLDVLVHGTCKLQCFDLLSTRANLPIMNVLVRMLSLTSLKLYDFDPAVLLLLRYFPQLTDLEIDTWCIGKSVLTRSLLCDALTGCTQLRKLRLCQNPEDIPLTSDFLTALHLVPLLTKLNLDAVHSTSFDFLKLVPRLTSLGLRSSKEHTSRATLLQALHQHVPLLTFLRCSEHLFSSDAQYMLTHFGQNILPNLLHLHLITQ
jgi:hypothetical protein